MKKYVIKILLFFVIVTLIDIAFGVICRHFNSHAKGGDTRNHYYIANQCNQDIIIFGSSRALHHYSSQTLEDSLGMSCYNCGVDGNGIVFFYGRLLMLTNRYTPKVIIYDIQSGFDVQKGDNSKYLRWMKRFYDLPGISDIFDLVNPMEKLKMKCQLYRYNSSFIQILTDNFHPIQETGYGGFRPRRKKMLYDPIVKRVEQLEEWDTIKEECMLRLVNLCNEKNIKLIFTYSPCYGESRTPCDDLIHRFILENNLTLLDHFSDKKFCLNKDYFYDSVHMNETGAIEFTKVLSSELKVLLNSMN